MGHNLSISEGKTSLFYVGEKPWHGLGTELKSPATAKEAIEAAGLDYPVELQPIYLQNKKEIARKKAIVRADKQIALGLATDSYKVIQNSEAFSFFDSVVGEGQAIYHTAGALGVGQRVWILAKLPDDIIVTKDDVVEKYLLLVNSHTGTSALKMYFTPVRVVCENTLIASYRDAAHGVSIRHMGDIKTKVDEARRLLGLAINYYARFSKDVHALTKYKMTDKELDSYFNYALSGKAKLDREMSTRMENQKNRLKHLFVKGAGNDSSKVKGTAWAAYNAVTEYADHDRAVRELSEDKTRRLSSIWLGSSASMKARAYEASLELVGVKSKQ